MKKLRCNISFAGEGFTCEMNLPDKYFDGLGRPLMHLLNNRLGATPQISWRPDWQCSEEPKAELPPIGDELQKLREVVASLEKKFDGGDR